MYSLVLLQDNIYIYIYIGYNILNINDKLLDQCSKL